MKDSYRTSSLRVVIGVGACVAMVAAIVTPARASQAQTIQFQQFADLEVNESDALTAKATSGLPVAFTSDTPAVCVVDGTDVVARTVGTCTVTARQPGNGTWDPAPPVRRSAHMDKGEVKQVITTRDLTTGLDEPTEFAFAVRPTEIREDQALPTGTYGIQIQDLDARTVADVDRPFDEETGFGDYSFNDPPNPQLEPGWYFAFGCYNGDANYTGAGENCGGMARPFQKYRYSSRVNLALTPSPARYGEGVSANITVTGPDGKLVKSPHAIVYLQWERKGGRDWGLKLAAEDGTAAAFIDDLAFGKDVAVFAQYDDPTSNYGMSVQRVFITVRQGIQSLTFAPLYNLERGKSEALVIDSNSDNPIDVGSRTPTVCRVVNGEVKALALGRCSVTASQDGSEEWRAAAPVTRQFDVVQRAAHLSYPDGRTVVGRPLPPLQPHYSGLTGDLRFTAAGLPEGLSVRPRTGVVSGTPTQRTYGPAAVSVRVSDAAGHEAGASFRVNVLPLPYPPRVAYPNGRGWINRAFPALKPHVSGFSRPVTFWVNRRFGSAPQPRLGLPPGLRLNGRTGAIIGTPMQTGTFTPEVIAWDGVTAVSTTVRIVIQGGAWKQRLSYPKTIRAAVGVPLAPAVPHAVGPGRKRRFSATGLPRGITISATSGVLRGMPVKRGSYRVKAVARVSKGRVARAKFSIRVFKSPLTASLSYPDVRALVGKRLAPVRPVVTGLAGRLRYQADRLPRGLTLRRSTGVLSGRPTKAGARTVRVTVRGSGTKARTRMLIQVFGR